ncbi:MAG: hypothetical protein RRA94_12235 [Bacteroidota bacterium]|nr:hypothetical protein [Bacteroidota bacterium]
MVVLLVQGKEAITGEGQADGGEKEKQILQRMTKNLMLSRAAIKQQAPFCSLLFMKNS